MTKNRGVTCTNTIESLLSDPLEGVTIRSDHRRVRQKKV